MKEELHALIVEDSEDDAQLLLQELKRGGYVVRHERVEDAEQMRKALETQTFDIVFADYSLPQFDAPSALKLLKQTGKDIPFVILLGTAAEDVAVAAMKAGAHDYVQKENLKRLLPAVERELREVRQRTERRRVEEALRVSDAQYRLLFECNPHPMWVYEVQTLKFLAVNDAAVHQYGYTRSEFLNMTIKDIREPDAITALLQHTARDAEGFSSAGLWKHRRKDGSLIDVEITSHGIVFDGKQAQFVLALDVTEKVKARQALQEKVDELAAMTQQLWHASKLATMGELAASIAHELNNPLATVSLRAETLLTQIQDDPQKQRSLQIIISEVERMAGLVTNLLQFTRRHHRQISTIDVGEEVSKSISFISYYLRNRRIKVVTDFEQRLPPILADRQQLRQVFLNLMTNAGDAMPQGGVLTVRVRADDSGERLVIEFTDTGEGIAKTELEKVWEPFYTSKPEGKGTGLGLPICSRIVEEHGGVISLESEVGKGTTVRVVLPISNGGASQIRRSMVEQLPTRTDKESEQRRTANRGFLS